MKQHIISLLLILSSLLINAQASLTIEGQTFTNSEDVWPGVEIPHKSPVRLIFRNNTISSRNREGYLLQAGDEKANENNNNLDGAIITGNRLNWSGTDMVAIPHGIFTGHNKDVIIRYNYLNHVPMAIIRKSSNNMGNSSGGVAYNIVRGGAVGIVVKGMSNVNIFNNTLYSDRTPSQTWRPLVHIYTNTDFGGYSVSHGTRIYNNIFYTKHETFNITIQDAESLKDFECDYNLYWSESGQPVFNVGGTEKTFAQWQAMGFDRHSVVVNPGFADFNSFVPSRRLDFGIDLGDDWRSGLSSSAVWGTADPEMTLQNGKWQVGAIVNSASVPSMNPVYTSAFFEEQNRNIIEVNFNSLNPDIVPPASAFDVKVNSVSVEVTGIRISQNTVFLTLSQPVTMDDNVTISYTSPANNPLQSNSGGIVASFNNHRVIKVEASEISGNIMIYPNPATSHITIANLPPIIEPYLVRVYDLGGKLHAELRLDPDYDINIPVSVTPGMYIVQVLLGNKILHLEKIIILK
jgi:hypothetical protein